MTISLTESQAITNVAELIYEYLPNKPHPFADQSISVQGVAQDLGLGHLYTGGSKRTAIASLLSRTLDTRRDRFCALVLELVRRGVTYRAGKTSRITREDIEKLNAAVTKVGFKIPELWDPAFLDALPRQTVTPPAAQKPAESTLTDLRNRFVALHSITPRQRGFEFERFLKELFAAFDLDPRPSFRMTGEQIDGSFQFERETYLLEAKWQEPQVGPGPLREFRDKVETKASWSRGAFISYSGFTPDGLDAVARGKATTTIGITGQDLFYVLNAEMPLATMIRLKTRHAAETGEFLVTVQELLLRG